MTTFAIFGGSFDPPHIAHTLVAAWALARGMDEVLVIPTFEHAFGKKSVPFEHRLAMSELAMAPLRSVRVLTTERDLGGESRTFHTLMALKKQFPSANFRLLIGADILKDADRWFRWDDLSRKAPPLVVGRQGYELTDPEAIVLPEVSSTEIRRRLGSGESVTGLLAPQVERYLQHHKLYSAS